MDGIKDSSNSNNYSIGNHFFKVLVQIHYSPNLDEMLRKLKDYYPGWAWWGPTAAWLAYRPLAS